MKTSRLLLTSVLGLSLLALSPRLSQAVPLTVPNFSFEENPVADGAVTKTMNGWVPFSNANVENPTSAFFTGAAGNGTPLGAHGAQTALVGIGDITSATSLTTLQANTIYSLTVAMGQGNGDTVGDVTVGFWLDNGSFGEPATGSTTTLLAANADTYIPNGSFRDFTFNYTPVASDYGRGLLVFLGQSSTNSTRLVAFDNVRVQAVATPEPSTYAMMALGLVALCVLGAKRKKDGQAL
jgi:hypothetical protein